MADTIEAEPTREELKVRKITDSLDRELLTSLPAGPVGRAVIDQNQLLEIAKTMATGKYSLPPHLRGNPGDCLAIREIAMDKGMSAFLLARHCYVVNDILCFDGQAVHSILEKSGRLAEALLFDYEGEGDEMVCIVTGRLRGTSTPRVYTSPRVKLITPKRSPLWQTDPAQQLGYLSVRRWAARFCPAALLGIYSYEEMMDTVIDVTPPSPNLLERLPGRIQGAGFAPDASEAKGQEQEAIQRVEALKAKRREIMAKARAAKSKKKTSPKEGLQEP